MMKLSRVLINANGDIEVDLIGYLGEEDCAAEEERLRQILAGLGLRVKVEDLRKKTPQQIAAELHALSGESHTTVQEPMTKKVNT